MTPQIVDTDSDLFIVPNDPNTDQIHLPQWSGEEPFNYTNIRQSFALAMHCEGICIDTIESILQTVDDACVNNERYLIWESEHNLTENSPS